MYTAVFVTIAIFMAGVIFTAGRLVGRIEKLEEARVETRVELQRIRDAVDTLQNLVRADHGGGGLRAGRRATSPRRRGAQWFGLIRRSGLACSIGRSPSCCITRRSGVGCREST